MAGKSGFSPLIIVVVVAVAVAAVFGFVVLKGGGGLPGLSQLTAPRATEKDFEFVEDATVRKHLVAQANQTSYRTKTLSEGAGLIFVNEVQIKGEDFNYRDVQYEPGDKEIKHLVSLTNTVYVKDYSDGKWWKQTIKPEELTEEEKDSRPTDFKEEFSKPDLKFKALGKEACGDLTCFKYEQLGLGIKRIFWFDDRQYLLRKEEAGYGEFISKVDYSYDGINITAPSPTKEVPAGKNIYDYYYGTESQGFEPAVPAYTPPADGLDYSVPAPDEIGY